MFHLYPVMEILLQNRCFSLRSFLLASKA